MPELELDSLMYRHTMTFLKVIYIADIALYTIGINFSFKRVACPCHCDFCRCAKPIKYCVNNFILKMLWN